MQLNSKDGIACDHCGTVHRQDFTYYSFDFRPVSVIDNHRPPLEMIFTTQIVFSLDICAACYDKLAQEVVRNYGAVMSPKRVPRVETVCDLSGKRLSGTYNFFHINITKVEVQMTGQPNVCLKCKTATFDDGKPCAKCGNLNFVKPAAVRADDRHLELNISEDTYKRLTEKAATVRQVASQWTTKS